MRFRRTVYGTAFGKTPLAKLWTPDIKKWRRGTGRTASSQNRTMAALRAALNLAVANRRVSSERVIEWRSVRQHRNADARRALFLDQAQRPRLIEHAPEAIGDLIAGIALTGARPGDLRTARRSQYEPRTESITFTSKVGPRTLGTFRWDERVREAARKAGLPEGVLPLHAEALMDGMATLDVARITGTSLAMIEKRYGHLVMHAARERLNAVNLL